MCRQQFFLEATDGQHLTAQGDFAGHGHIGTHWNLRQRRDQRRAHADTGARAVFGRGTFRHVDVHVVLLVEIGSDPQATGATAHDRLRGGDRFDHDVTQRTGLDQLPFTRNDHRFDGQQLTTDLGPGKAGDLTDLVLLLGQPIAELAHAQQVLELFAGNLDLDLLGPGMFLDHLAADLRDLALKPTYTGFAGVVADDVTDGRDIDLELFFLQPVGLDLLGYQVLDRDVDLLVLGVTRQADDFHAVEQRRRDVHRVRGAQEHYVGKVVIDFQVMVVEVVVLLGVKHLQQRRRRITAHVAAHLVDLVEQEQRVTHAHLGHLLDQATRHRADVGATVATNLGLVTHATEGHAHELAVGGGSDRLGQRGLADAGRPDQAQHRTADLLDALLHGKVFEDAFLDLFQAIVVGIEDFLGLGQVQTHLALGLPRHLHEPVEVRTNHRGLGRHRRHLLELVQLGLGLGIGILWQASGVEALFQLFDFVVTFFAVAELFLNGLHLLIQVVLALAALHLLLDPAADTLLDLQ
ncbi:hypothetical protein D3C81_823070 [compost metagenome]